MKGFLSAAAVLAGVAVAVPGLAGAESGPPVSGQVSTWEAREAPVPLPDATVVGRGGEAVALDRFAGRYVVLNFWATWCAPCVRELPSLARLDTALPDGTAQVVLISQDRGGFAQTDPFMERLGVDALENFIDERLAFSRAVGVHSLPTTLLIDPQGREVGRLVGSPEWDAPEARALIDWYLARGGEG